MDNKIIKHLGTVSRIDADKLIVTIHTVSACHTCDAKGVCNVAEQKDKEIEVKAIPGRNYAVGDVVEVKMLRTAGLKAVLWAYLVPFILLITTLVVTFSLTSNQAMSGLLAITSLVPYFFGLYLFRNRLSSSFSISLV